MLSTSSQLEKLDPRVKRTRQALEQAFTEALQHKSFSALTVEDITRRAGVNRATFYAHFADKYALLDHSIRQSFLSEIDRRMLHACHYTRENLLNLIVAVCEFTRTACIRTRPQPQFESLVEAQVKQVLHDLLLKWLEQVKINVPPETAATAGSWAIYGLAAQWNRSRPRKPAEQFAAEVLPLVAANFRAA